LLHWRKACISQRSEPAPEDAERLFLAKYHIDSIKIVHVECVADFMYVIARYESTNAGQKAFGVNLVVAGRTRDGWLIVAQEAAVPDPATAILQLDIPRSR
jgi:hypothetical protein